MKKASLVHRLTPINLLQEKEKFFADQTYNPQFEYDSEITDSDLHRYGRPSKTLANQAEEIINRTFFDRTEEEVVASAGPYVPEPEILDKFKTFLKMHRLDKRYTIQISSSYLSRTSVTSSSIKLRQPLKFREESLLGAIYHELGTHALRQVNSEAQPWFKQKKKYGLNEYLFTEEGLAVIHSLLPRSEKSAFRSARFFLVTHYAQELSFAETYQKATRLFSDPEKRWTAVVRQKRGLTDTSQPGGLTKDQVYFAGFTQVYKWLQLHDGDITPLYFGKIALEDVHKAHSLNPHYQPILPSFFTTQPDKYRQLLDEIGYRNAILH